jgi:hypothetical protein
MKTSSAFGPAGISTRRAGRWPLRLLGIVGLLLVGAGFVRLIQEAREGARDAQCRGKLFRTGFALQSYLNRHGSLPPAALTDATGKPMHSWRALLLIDREETGFKEVYHLDEPWDGPHNRAVVDPFDQFSCPSDIAARGVSLPITNFVAVVGEGTLWDAKRPFPDWRLLPSNKILLIEMPGSDIRWTEPRDLTIDEALHLFASPAGRLRSPHPRGLNYVSVGPEGERSGALPPDNTAARLREMLQVDRSDRGG